MKLLYIHAKDLSIETTRKARSLRKMKEKLGPNLEPLTDLNRTTKSENALLALVCVERKDRALDLSKVRADILKARAIIGVAEIVIGAFAHLSRETASPDIAKQIIDRLVLDVSDSFPATKTYPFGWDRSLELRVPDHHFNVAFRTFRPTLKERIGTFFAKKKEWVKLNFSYLAATTTNIITAFAAAKVAEKAGLSRENAASWFSFLTGFTCGFVALVATWRWTHLDRYKGASGRLIKDGLELFKNVWKAQLITTALVVPLSFGLAKLDSAISLIVAAQQIMDKLLFVPLFNFFSRNYIKNIEKE